MCGYDREGSPIWYDVIGPVDPKGLFLSASKQDFIKSKIRDCEMLQKECNLQTQRVRSQSTDVSLLVCCRSTAGFIQSDWCDWWSLCLLLLFYLSHLFFFFETQLGRTVESITMIYDVEGLGLKHLWKPAIETYGEVWRRWPDTNETGIRILGWLTSSNNVQQILQMFEENYPEGLKRLFVIKGGFDFMSSWYLHQSILHLKNQSFIYADSHFLLQPLKSSLWPTTSSSTSWARTQDRRSASSGVRLFIIVASYFWERLQNNSGLPFVVCLVNSELAGGFTETHWCRGAACDIRG